MSVRRWIRLTGHCVCATDGGTQEQAADEQAAMPAFANELQTTRNNVPTHPAQSVRVRLINISKGHIFLGAVAQSSI
jgi:hypothetical protein